ncbi:helicase C-terminal domain-containing protein [Pyronema omphalodes]|nr:helicase C-terminal domain-containing protein [Pyronema omphalodes]
MAEETARDFHHPYTPYDIQLQFMNALYNAIDDGCVGIFESPTGTGKSLSLICGSLTWLRDHKNKDILEQLEAEDDGDDDEPAWVKEHAMKQRKEKLLRDKMDLEERLKAIRLKEAKEKEIYERGGLRDFKKMRKGLEVEKEEEDEDQFLLDDYESDDETGSKKKGYDDDGLSKETRDLMMKLGMSLPGAALKPDDELELPDETKIFFCSRTHSQLSQFVNELRRVDLPSSMPGDSAEQLSEQIKHLSLGSRKNLCINPKVTKLQSVTAMNEQCLDMQKSGTSENKRCSFLPKKEDQALVTSFRDHALATIRDIEDLSNLGKKLGTCPYYATRSAIKPSEIVTLPYPLLLQKYAREALGISLKGHVVVIDEAHNLIDAISSIHSIQITLSQLQLCKAQLDVYLGKFKNRLKGSNKVYVMQIQRLCDGLATHLEGLGKKGKEGEVQPHELLAAKGIDQINFYKLQKYITESKLARKLEGYITHTEQKKVEQQKLLGKASEGKARDSVPNVPTAPVLTQLQGFLMSLTNPSSEGKIFYGRDNKDLCFKYMLLDPAFHFKDIVEEARAVILAGGTMQPMNDFISHLFPYLPENKIRTLSCGHVIPKENLLAWPMVKGPTGMEFEFTYEKRTNLNMVDELGRAIINACQIIPHGVVCFFPSYAYLSFVVLQWQKKPATGSSIWERLGQKKQIFQESSEKSSVEETLAEYGQAIDTGKGGLLLSVVGGKMSEGINFNDNLGRGVIMIGLPFPNAQGAEWQAKLRHVEKVAYNFLSDSSKTETEKLAEAKAAGKDYYENACMRAVNQSIGRAIRHREDYATIVLIDKRYTTERIQNKLPGWIKTGLVHIDLAKGEGRFADFMRASGAFFRSKK